MNGRGQAGALSKRAKLAGSVGVSVAQRRAASSSARLVLLRPLGAGLVQDAVAALVADDLVPGPEAHGARAVAALVLDALRETRRNLCARLALALLGLVAIHAARARTTTQ
eukprot:CAMPEP_0202045754 /NCGR_PEP_ID=MMETSP0963-20130614/914_1 /ASSEMBLY_ACC=CAM_ASM_000494 /TAXON_ID=4773 /ORGANISM="Schizochytrium aggregatum, Strain ATCC28209" /LENGTH=110 /DNA_ID=CAMNT_0048610369 /DNA_START=264 /DNA_END=594 /DNA_ORIENTATION=+